MWSLNVEAKTCLEQLEDFHRLTNPVRNARIMKFTGVDGRDVYNPTIPFECCGMTVIGGRVEARHNEVSQTMFFRFENDAWHLIPDAPVLNLQDPFMTWINGDLIVGGVYVLWDGDRLITYRTDFYKGKSIYDLELLTSGPEFMKDVRIVGLPDGRIALFSRPQGQKMMEKYGCIAKIGFTICDRLEDISPETIENAPHLEGHFVSTEWGGCNQLHVLKNGCIGVIGHKSYYDGAPDDMKIHYHGMA
ncbi:MAG: DUF1861 family protein, partial [Saccharofermentanales bacterium]